MGALKGPGQTLDLIKVHDELRRGLEVLRGRPVGPEDQVQWRDYLHTIELLLQIEDRLASEGTNGRSILTTREMADRLGISVKALLRRKKQGHIHPSIAHGKALGWRVEDATK